ncbi:MAG: hypothetical protein QXX12_01080 [Nanopusillaceae archaeon]
MSGFRIEVRDRRGRVKARLEQRRGKDGVVWVGPDGKEQKVPPPWVMRELVEAAKRGDQEIVERVLREYPNAMLRGLAEHAGRKSPPAKERDENKLT